MKIGASEFIPVHRISTFLRISNDHVIDFIDTEFCEIELIDVSINQIRMQYQMPTINSPSRPSPPSLDTEANVRPRPSAPAEADGPATAETGLVLSGGTPRPANATNETIVRAASARLYQEAVAESSQKEDKSDQVFGRQKEKAPGYNVMVAEYPDGSQLRNRPQESQPSTSGTIDCKKQSLSSLGLKVQNLNLSELMFLQNGPFFAGIYDSSNGGIIAAKNIGKILKESGTNNVRKLLILDHGNAPYGTKSRAELIVLVRKALLLAKKLDLDAVVMACNTACTAFRISPDDREGIDLETIGIPVIDLISNTAKEIVKHGGKKPILFSTEATAKDDMYENRIIEAARDLGREPPTIKRIPGGDLVRHPGRDLATLINNLHHKKDAGIKEIKVKLTEYLASVDEHDTSVWLVCTHYPEVKDLINDELRNRGLTNIPVIDPIHVQANALLPVLLKRSQTDLRERQSSTESLVITSGKHDAVRNSVEALYGESLPILSTDSFENFNRSLVDELLYKKPGDEALPDGAIEATHIDTQNQPQAPSAAPQ